MIPCNAPGTSGPPDQDETFADLVYEAMHRFPFPGQARAEALARAQLARIEEDCCDED
jgi:hypothetical protein